MIAARIEGGLGNQMFQYAAAKAAAVRLGTELLLDAAAYNAVSERKGRSFLLDRFPNITEKKARPRDVMKLYPWVAVYDGLKGKTASIPRRIASKAFRYLCYGLGVMPKRLSGNALKSPVDAQSLALIPCSRVYFQGGSGYDAGFTAIPDNVYVVGGFESEKYFGGFAGHIRRAYSFAPSLRGLPLYAEISSNQSVAVHIRRGDKTKSRKHEASNMDYLLSAMNILEHRIENPIFYIFSDDMPWCMKNLPPLVKKPLRFAESPPGTDNVLTDMFLMSNCKHNIIGPSTFSWWAAWLNSNPGKIVAAPHPKLWFRDTSGRSDLLPEKWIAVE
ncbi:MAG: alpha-1,2-fucosyltransferase [Synergistaceae bacterium]|nr:alpha-1,2-fucosyltransferase [Synergistaceae bacterium]